MTKRSNPFVEDFIPQSKTHVGLKQFNNNEDRMQKVYEKTLHLLFKGAKKSPEEVIKIMDAVPSARKDCMKQLLINKDGTLMNSKIVFHVVSDPISQDVGKHHTAKECTCGSQLNAAPTHCSYCEAPLCSTCHKPCARCHLPFCSKCSLFGSEGIEICLSCYG